MKNRILTYAIFGALAILGIALYFVNPNLVEFQVTMSFGASLIGAIFVAVSLEAINLSRHKKSTQTIQKYMLSTLNKNLEQFYYWYISFLARRYNVGELEQVDDLSELIQNLFNVTRKQIDAGKVVDENYTVDRVATKIDMVADALEKVNRTLKSEMPTLITNEIIENEDIEFFEKLQVKINDVQFLDRLSEQNELLVEILNDLNENKIIVLKKDNILTERLKQKLFKKGS